MSGSRIQKGNILIANLGPKSPNSRVVHGTRPVVVVSEMNFGGMAIVAPLTSSNGLYIHEMPLCLELNPNKYRMSRDNSVVLVRHIRGIEQSKIRGFIAKLDERDQERLDKLILQSMDIKFQNQEGKRMNEIQKVFNYQGNQVRTVLKDGESWFVAKDVCDILELTDGRKSIELLDDDERNIIPVMDSMGRMQDSYVVNEPGLYSLVLKSRKPEAKAFKRWITHEVIPQIRKTGSYSVQPMSELEILKKSVDMLIEQKQKLAQVEDKLETVNHRINSLDAVNVEGDPQQRLVKMVQKLAYKSGITYSNAWNQFKESFNTAYRTNLTARMNNYCQVNNLKKITIPAFLAEFNQLEDGIRVADKLLNM